MNRRLVAVCFVGLAMAGCHKGSEARFTMTSPETDAERRGQAVFYDFCNKCHPQGEAGVGPALDDARLKADAMRVRIRNGSGRMPAFSRYEISERELYDLVDYLDTFRDERIAR